MKKVFLISSAVIMLLTLLCNSSCKKDNDTPDEPVLTGDSVLYRVKKNNVIISEYTYNTDLTVKAITHNDDAGNFSASAAFEYSPAAHLVKINNVYSNTAFNSYDNCSYNSENLLSYIVTFCGSVQDHTQTLQYDNQGRLIHYYLGYGGGYFGTNYIYGSNTNVMKEYDSGDLVCDTTYYTYDNKKNIIVRGLPRMDPDFLSANNVTQQLHKDQSGTPKPTDSYNSVFEYNSNGLPTKETRTYLNSTVDVYEFIYY